MFALPQSFFPSVGYSDSLFAALTIGNKCRIFKICERRRIDDDVTGRRDRIHGNMPRAQRIWCGRLDRDFGVAGDEITIQ